MLAVRAMFISTGVIQSLQAYEMDEIGLTQETANAIAFSGNAIGAVLLLGYE